MVDTVIDGGQVIVYLLDEEVSSGGFLVQSTLKVLQLTQEVEVRGNRWSALFHKPYKGTDRMWVSVFVCHSSHCDSG